MTAITIIDPTPLLRVAEDDAEDAWEHPLRFLFELEAASERLPTDPHRYGRAWGSHLYRYPASVRQEPEVRLPIRALVLVGLAGPWLLGLLLAGFLSLGAA